MLKTSLHQLALFTFLLFITLLLSGCATFSDNFSSSSSSFSEPKHDYKVGRPYTIRGRTYVPAVDWNYDEIGLASWYSEGFHGKPTASGERYNHNDMTAAHPTLPMPTVVRVTRLDNGKSVIVRINDRGPFVEGRIIDLSRKAAQQLDMKAQGLARVRVQVLETETRQLLARMGVPADVQRMGQTAAAPARTTAAGADQASRQISSTTTASVGNVNRQIAHTTTSADRTIQRTTTSAAQTVNSAAAAATDRLAGDANLWVVQLGSFSNSDAAKKVLNQPFINGPTRVQQAEVGGRTFHRAQLGPYNTRAEAERVLREMHSAGITGAAVMVANP